ncbi:hypothetical protein [Mesonia sp. K4-1]|uniref:hypothetical protein n=1 Tax=Mesonia sp. K4-1 TaxID=2602760 RepID=UPI0011C9BEB6|nr:hypothetical protein [Mesonia sp. K4-1]TXK78674.1 hypothetical protein FT986_02455 [Mesonia sp. K4-1]
MKRPLFINTNTEAITEALKKIGKGRLEAAIKIKDLEMPKRKAKFLIEWQGNRGVLKYAYSTYANKPEYTDIAILHNEELPEFGWEIKWYRY